jgi:hypothetical protein
MPAESLLIRPPQLTSRLHSNENALLPSQRIRSFGSKLKPRYIVGAKTLDQ